MKVKTIKSYYDLQLKKDIAVGHEHTVDDERGKELIAANVATQIVEKSKKEESKGDAKEGAADKSGKDAKEK